MAQLAVTFWLATTWDTAPGPARIGGFCLLVLMMTYNIIVVTHLFVHVHWFNSPWLNRVSSMVNSVNIGQSVQAYEFSHVRNHHRYNNDPQDPTGTTKDTSSTYRAGKDGEHAPVLSYVFGGALNSLISRGRELGYVTRLWRVGPREIGLLALAARSPGRRAAELHQLRLDRMACCPAVLVFALISWQWTLACYLPAWYLALVLVNVQNYYRHYGARPGDRTADSVSYYGQLYNLIAFNDGYHQEHHMSPRSHWTQLPAVRDRYRDRLAETERIVSPVPAMLGFLHRSRPLLHKVTAVRTPEWTRS